MADVERVSAASFEGGPECSEEEEGKVGAGGDTEVFTAEKVGEGASSSREGRQLEMLGSGGNGLSECCAGLRANCCEKGQ